MYVPFTISGCREQAWPWLQGGGGCPFTPGSGPRIEELPTAGSLGPVLPLRCKAARSSLVRSRRWCRDHRGPAGLGWLQWGNGGSETRRGCRGQGAQGLLQVDSTSGPAAGLWASPCPSLSLWPVCGLGQPTLTPTREAGRHLVNAQLPPLGPSLLWAPGASTLPAPSRQRMASAGTWPQRVGAQETWWRLTLEGSLRSGCDAQRKYSQLGKCRSTRFAVFLAELHRLREGRPAASPISSVPPLSSRLVTSVADDRGPRVQAPVLCTPAVRVDWEARVYKQLPRPPRCRPLCGLGFLGAKQTGFGKTLLRCLHVPWPCRPARWGKHSYSK